MKHLGSIAALLLTVTPAMASTVEPVWNILEEVWDQPLEQNVLFVPKGCIEGDAYEHYTPKARSHWDETAAFSCPFSVDLFDLLVSDNYSSPETFVTLDPLSPWEPTTSTPVVITPDTPWRGSTPFTPVFDWPRFDPPINVLPPYVTPPTPVPLPAPLILLLNALGALLIFRKKAT